MSLILRRRDPGLDDIWQVYSEELCVGTIVHDYNRPEPIWKWSILLPWPSPDVSKNGLSQTREEVMRDFREAWGRYRELLGDERWQEWVQHSAEVEARRGRGRY